MWSTLPDYPLALVRVTLVPNRVCVIERHGECVRVEMGMRIVAGRNCGSVCQMGMRVCESVCWWRQPGCVGWIVSGVGSGLRLCVCGFERLVREWICVGLGYVGEIVI